LKPSVSVRELAMNALVRVEQEQAFSNLVLNQLMKKHDLPRSDAGLVTELVYGTIQRMNTLDYYMSQFLSKGTKKLEPWVRQLLRLSFYQIVFLDRIPPHAAVNEAVTIAGKRGHKGISGMVNAVLRNALRNPELLQIPKGLRPVEEISLAYSHPQWLVRRWLRQFGEETTRLLCESNNQPPSSSIRVNRIRTTTEALTSALREQGYEPAQSMLAPDGLTVEGGGNMAHASGFEQGLYSIQDESSMLVAEMLMPESGMRVLDCCAAPGGKTTHIAEKMKDQGEIIACDIHEHKKKLIEAQAERLGLQSIHAETQDARQLAQLYKPESFDRILLDAPCSGFGVIRRKPDLKWTKTEADIMAIAGVQRELLDEVAALLKPGGVLVYSTCTLDPEENEQMVERFLNEHADYSLDARAMDRLPSLSERFIAPGMLRLLPHQYNSDGFFIAALRKSAISPLVPDVLE
jgi:16S rRNA (cytosine967-C5)-methyltransferase